MGLASHSRTLPLRDAEAGALLADLIGEERLPPLVAGLLPALLADRPSRVDRGRFAARAAELLGALAARSGGGSGLRAWADRAARGFESADSGASIDVLDLERRVVETFVTELREQVDTLEATLVDDLERFVEQVDARARTGENSDALYRLQRDLYVRTRGGLCRWIQAARRRVQPPRAATDREGVLSRQRGFSVDAARSTLERDGVVIFERALDASTCDRLVDFARSHPALPLLGDGRTGDPTPIGASTATVTRHVTPDAVLLARDWIAELATDPTLIEIARAYLACEPVLASAAFRWSTAVHERPDPQAAQLYHFDLNRLNFLKVFVYLTDVNADTGPHCFVRGSHRRRPTHLWRDGRLPDDEVESSFERHDILEITAPRGTVIVEDTRGLHRGKQLVHGERLMFQTELADSMLGKPYSPIALEAGPWHREQVAANPWFWQRYGLIGPPTPSPR